jgi:hypothetical protein
VPNSSKAERPGGFASKSRVGGTSTRRRFPALPEEGAIERVPEAVRLAARAAFESRDPTVRVADLIYDSLVDGDRRADGTDGRQLRFGTAEWGVAVSARHCGETLHLSYRFGPPHRATVEIRHPGGVTLGTTDANGAGSVEGILPGLVSLRFSLTEPPGTRPVQTAWVRL